MINISGLDNSVFAPQAPITGDNTNFAKNLSAIINPTQALEQKQNEQIAKSVADLQMSSIYPKIQQKFLEAREKYISDYKDALKSHKGMGRLKLTPQEQLNFDRRKADMQNYVAWGKGATASLDKVNQDVIAALKAGEIEPGAYEKWFNGYMDEITKSKNGGDVPNAYSHFINANLIHPKVKSENEDKIVEFLEKGQTGIYQNEKGEKVEGHDDEKLLRQINNYSATKDLSEKEKERYFNLAKGQYKSPDKPEKEMTAYEKASLGIRYKELSDKEKEKAASVKEITPEPGARKTLPQTNETGEPIPGSGTMMRDGTTRWPVSAYNIPFTGDAQEIDPETEKPTGKTVTLKGATRAEVVDNNGKKYTIVTKQDKAEDGTITEKKYIVHNADDTRTKLPKGVVLKGYDDKPTAQPTKKDHKDNPMGD